METRTVGLFQGLGKLTGNKIVFRSLFVIGKIPDIFYVLKEVSIKRKEKQFQRRQRVMAKIEIIKTNLRFTAQQYVLKKPARVY